MKVLKKIKAGIIALPVLKQILQWTKRSSLPGLAGVPVFDVLVFLRNEIRRNTLVFRASSLAFSFILALFPTIIFLFTLIPYLPLGNFQDQLVNFLDEVLPSNAHGLLFESLSDIINKPRGGLLSVGFLLALLFSSNGVLSMMRSFDKTYKHTFRTRNAVQKRLVAFKLTFILSGLLIVSVGLIFFGNRLIRLLLDSLDAANYAYYLFFALKWVVLFLLFYMSISMIYRHAPATLRKFPIINAGAGLATLASLFLSLGFSYYVDRFQTYNQVYGSIGTFIVLMLWMQLNAFVLLVGYELNASIAVNRNLQRMREADDVLEDPEVSANY